jgi:hypothetical protein
MQTPTVREIDALQEPEGIETTSSDGWGEYPLDAVFVRTEPRSVSEVVRRIKSDRYIMDPDFQRDFVWQPQKQSKLIESCVMRIPLPVFYVAEAADGRIIVVDGLQRLTTFVRFLGNQLRLVGLASSDVSAGGAPHILEGKIFKELPINLQERIQDTPLTMYILDAKAPERARLDIFERVNSGEPLTRQQMRNALYNGPATVWLREAAAGDPFRSATGQSLNPKTMRAHSCVMAPETRRARDRQPPTSKQPSLGPPAEFSDANLGNANLSGATLASTNLSGATLAGADLRGASLGNAQQLDKACGTSAKLDPGLPPLKACAVERSCQK